MVAQTASEQSVPAGPGYQQDSSPRYAQPAGGQSVPAGYQQESPSGYGQTAAGQSPPTQERRGGWDRRTQVLSGDQVSSERRSGLDRRLTPAGR